MGQKRTSRSASKMSAKCQKRTCLALSRRRFCALLESARRKVAFLFFFVIEPDAIDGRAVVRVVHHAVNNHFGTARLELHDVAFFPLPSHGSSYCYIRLGLLIFEEFPSHDDANPIAVWIGLAREIEIEVDRAHDAVPKLFVNQFF